MTKKQAAKQSDRLDTDITDATPISTDIQFSQVHEDPELELAVVEELAARAGRPLRVLCVGSGGCTALSMLTSPAVERVDAIDINPAQVELIELKRAAVATLPLHEQLVLFGERGEPSRGDRVGLYDQLRVVLPQRSRAYWDARRHELKVGLHKLGTFDQMVAEVGAAFEEAGVDPLERPAQALGLESWWEIFQRVFDAGRLRERIGNAMTGYSDTRSFAQHFSAAFAAALRRWAKQDNYFLHHIFRRTYNPDAGVCPPYLLEEGQAAIREQGTDRLTVHTGNFLGKMIELREQEGRYDLIQTSDLSDWMPTREVHKLMSGVKDSLNDGGAVLARRLNADHSLAKLVGTYLQVDTALSSQLKEQDRSFLYSEVVVGFRPQLAA